VRDPWWAQAMFGSWPSSFASQPPNRLISRQGDSGPAKCSKTTADEIKSDVAKYRQACHAAKTRGDVERGFRRLQQLGQAELG